MKRIFSFLLAVVLVLSFSLMATPTLASSSPVWYTVDQHTNSGNTTAGSVAKPGNVTEGNLVILIIVKQNSLNITNPGIIPPDGFNLIRYEHDSAAAARPEVLAYWKIATDSEPATYNFTVEHDDPQWKAIAGRVTGHCPTTPIGKHSGTHSGDTTVTSLAIPGIVTSEDNVLLVGAVIARGDTAAPTNFTKPATMDELWAIGGSGSGNDGAPGTGGGEEAFATQDATEARTFNWTGASHAAGLMFEILLANYALTMAAAPTGNGTPTAEQIDVLQEFRDVVLLESAAGSQFVALYYRLSPPIADFIAKSDLLRTLVRELLVDTAVWIVEATGNIWRN